MDYNKLESLINFKGYTKSKVAKSIGMSDNGFNKMIRAQSMTVETLEKIAKFFELHPSYFYDGIDSAELDECKKNNANLKSFIKEKEKQIKDKEEIIQLLKQQLKKS